ncbi:LysE family transporter [Enterobacter cloacae subsp. cloacae]|nr:LysE family transporter [Enterobacter cloacae subsp. cloacae]
MEMSIVAGFWVVSFLLIMTPGADWALCDQRRDQRAARSAGGDGLMSGHLLATLVVVAGVGVLIAQHPLALSGLTIAGRFYLLWLGITLLRHPCAGKHRTACRKLETVGSEGIMYQQAQSKSLLTVSGVASPSCRSKGSWSIATQMSALGVMHLITCTLVYLLVGYGSKAVLATVRRRHVR